jgi:AcrR family transcriptional regulator
MPATKRGEKTRERIVRAAASLLFRSGASETSLDEVLERAKASKSQIYHYFQDKDALVAAVIDYQAGRIVSAQREAVPLLDSVRALELWRDALITMFENSGGMRCGCPLGSLANEVSTRSEDGRTHAQAGFQQWVEYIESGLRAMQLRGELAPDADPHEIAIATLAAVQGGILLSKTSRTSNPLRTALNAAIKNIQNS